MRSCIDFDTLLGILLVERGSFGVVECIVAQLIRAASTPGSPALSGQTMRQKTRHLTGCCLSAHCNGILTLCLRSCSRAH